MEGGRKKINTAKEKKRKCGRWWVEGRRWKVEVGRHGRRRVEGIEGGRRNDGGRKAEGGR